MFIHDQYQLLDFGGGRKLERFGERIIDRPTPAAMSLHCQHPELWPHAHARFERISPQHGIWRTTFDFPDDWQVRHADTVFELKLTPFGHLGVFPEQADNWDWISNCAREAGRPLKILNLFAYTGGSTLAAAAAGAQVVHVDAAKNIIGWARRMAQLSGLSNKPIRWIAEDAGEFVRRELRRGNQYDAVILDPPSYGHGPKGQTWTLQQDLSALLESCGALTTQQRSFILVTCHSSAIGPNELRDLLQANVLNGQQTGIEARQLEVRTQDGRSFTQGVVARWRS